MSSGTIGYCEECKKEDVIVSLWETCSDCGAQPCPTCYLDNKHATLEEPCKRVMRGRLHWKRIEDGREIKAIETIGPRGFKYRSRLEAKWAWIFEALGWPWEYEPIDLDGYIPDFIIHWPHADLLVEVKGESSEFELELHSGKIHRSGWAGNYLLCGSKIFTASGSQSGQSFWMEPSLGMLSQRESANEDPWHAHALIFFCTGCKHVSIRHEQASWYCYRCGHHDGDGHLGSLHHHTKLPVYGSSRDDMQIMWALWSDASNKSRWEPKR